MPQFLNSIPLLPSSYPGRLASLNSTDLNEVDVILRLTVSQSVSLAVEPHLGLMTRYVLLFDSYSLIIVARPL
jgi:hypothetical protein